MEPWIQGEIDLEGALVHMGAEQKAFMECTDRIACAAGGFRSGKSVAACCFEILLGQRIPNSFHLIGRLTAPALRDTTQKTFMELVPRDWVQQWKEAENRMIFKNGSEYLFRHLDLTNPELAGHIRSLNLTSFLVDQSEEISEGTFNTLLGRLSRKTNPRVHAGRLVLNPAGQDWNWRKFFDPDRAGIFKEFRGFVIPTQANAHNLPEGYVDDLISAYPADWAERFIYASFADFSDLVYKDFNHKMHVYDARTFNPPKHWPIYCGVDIGGVDPWAWVYMAVDPDNGSIFFFDEIYERGILIKSLAELHFEIIDGRNFAGLAYDYENQQAAMEMEDHGITGTPAIKQVMPGIFKFGQYLHPTDMLASPFNGVRPSPRMYISTKCVNMIREFGGYKWEKNRKGEATGVPADGNDHAMDAARYAVHTFRPEPAKWQKDRLSERPGLNMMSRVYWLKEQERRAEEEKTGKTQNSPFLPPKRRVPFSRLWR